MSPRTKLEYLETVLKRYRRCDRIGKSHILDELCANCGFHRKHAIRLLRKLKRRRRVQLGHRGPKPVYNTDEILQPLKKIWLAANLPCSKRLKAILPLWLPGYEHRYGSLLPDNLKLLQRISAATIDRLLKPIRVRHTRHCTTKPGTLLRNQIPIATEQWNQSKPGFLEADTVAHCGESMAGQFAYTIDCVDIATGWSEQRAVWGRGETDVLMQIRHIEQSLPFPLLGFDCDNGSEFLNHHLLRHFRDRSKPVLFTRSRAYHKDDNAHIEQKNWTHVRQWLGYDRFDNPRVVSLLNDLYCNEWRLFQNFFCPSVKLLDKKRVGSKTIKIHDSPKTPYQRVLESSHVSQEIKTDLATRFVSLNPFTLREFIERKLKNIFQSCYKQTICGQRSTEARFGNI